MMMAEGSVYHEPERPPRRDYGVDEEEEESDERDQIMESLVGDPTNLEEGSGQKMGVLSKLTGRVFREGFISNRPANIRGALSTIEYMRRKLSFDTDDPFSKQLMVLQKKFPDITVDVLSAVLTTKGTLSESEAYILEMMASEPAELSFSPTNSDRAVEKQERATTDSAEEIKIETHDEERKKQKEGEEEAFKKSEADDTHRSGQRSVERLASPRSERLLQAETRGGIRPQLRISESMKEDAVTHKQEEAEEDDTKKMVKKRSVADVLHWKRRKKMSGQGDNLSEVWSPAQLTTTTETIAASEEEERRKKGESKSNSSDEVASLSKQEQIAGKEEKQEQLQSSSSSSSTSITAPEVTELEKREREWRKRREEILLLTQRQQYFEKLFGRRDNPLQERINHLKREQMKEARKDRPPLPQRKNSAPPPSSSIRTNSGEDWIVIDKRNLITPQQSPSQQQFGPSGGVLTKERLDQDRDKVKAQLQRNITMQAAKTTEKRTIQNEKSEVSSSFSTGAQAENSGGLLSYELQHNIMLQQFREDPKLADVRAYAIRNNALVVAPITNMDLETISITRELVQTHILLLEPAKGNSNGSSDRCFTTMNGLRGTLSYERNEISLVRHVHQDLDMECKQSAFILRFGRCKLPSSASPSSRPLQQPLNNNINNVLATKSSTEKKPSMEQKENQPKQDDGENSIAVLSFALIAEVLSGEGCDLQQQQRRSHRRHEFTKEGNQTDMQTSTEKNNNNKKGETSTTLTRHASLASLVTSSSLPASLPFKGAAETVSGALIRTFASSWGGRTTKSYAQDDDEEGYSSNSDADVDSPQSSDSAAEQASVRKGQQRSQSFVEPEGSFDSLKRLINPRRASGNFTTTATAANREKERIFKRSQPSGAALRRNKEVPPSPSSDLNLSMVEDLPPNPTFQDKIAHPSAKQLRTAIANFVSWFVKKKPQLTEAHTNDKSDDGISTLVYAFLARMEQSLQVHPLWENLDRYEFLSAKEDLHKYLFSALYTAIFKTESSEIKDKMLYEKIKKLQFVMPEHLEIDPRHCNGELREKASMELLNINSFISPKEKLMCILNCCRILIYLLQEANSPAGADDFIPLLIYALIKANPPDLHSNISYISRFCESDIMIMENVCFFTHLLFSVSFIEMIDASSLNMDPSEFERLMGSP